ncbi:LacI family DNA-binding transcriptional regulator [Chryseolinea lacunae]|uniref:LacI family DNA-binding transcriptional regulator n=1 Tax=Chryseolinea lacunae TaxID=2801331 RepID=A0ABS1KZE1_9BACT|nr:LacI family DNA-binding transcriptional regulator [Chryseolinea lacunae]MBL0744538.1 LacI family DNA-binding transcriptional regulator [Chryseolinea lacunae]
MSKQITIYDIAEALQLSPATVSRGLKDHPAIRKDTRKRIVDKAREMGYQQNHFASNLRKSKSNTIGVIVPRLNSYFMASVISGMEKVANAAGYNLIISQSIESKEKEFTNVKTLYDSRVDGLLVSLAYDTEDISHFDLFLAKGIPLIFFDRVFEHPQCTSIVIDNFKAGYEVTQHLIDQGCKRIAHVTGNIMRNVYSDRLRGYKQALANAGLPFDEALVYYCNLSEQAGAEAASHLLALPHPPDGVFCTNDTTAVNCMRVLKQAGIRIPEQIAVAGFNNDPLSKVIEPNLTTLNYPGQEMGELAAATLIRKLDRNEGSSINTLVLRHDLIVRESSLRKK